MEAFRSKRIVVGVDFSDIARAALDCAREIARRADAELLLVYADRFVPPVDFVEAPVSAYLDALPRMKEVTEEKLAAYGDEFAADVRHTPIVRVDTPVSAISAVAEESDADLIILGTHGRGGLRRAILGSVAESVLRESSRPVLTVRGRECCPEGGVVRRIVCPIDQSETARRALVWAGALAGLFGARLTILAVGAMQEANENEVTGSLPANVRERTEVDRHVVRTSDDLISFARELSCELLVIGARHGRFSDTTVIGASVEQITRHACCPALSVIGV